MAKLRFASAAKEQRVTDKPIAQLAINTIRTLSIDAIQQANSGHPGTPMGMAPVVYCLWQRFLRFDPEDPIWPNRDRFVLSAGHASMLLYSMLHLTGVKAVSTRLRDCRQALCFPRRHQDLSTARQPLSGPSRISLDLGCGGHDGSAWPRRCHERRHGVREQVAGRSL